MLGTWRFEAKCFNDPHIQELLRGKKDGTGYDPFFDMPEAKHARWGKEYCSDCPVRLACMAEAMKSLNDLKHMHYDGIWGGTTLRKRRSLRKKQHAQILSLVTQMREQSQDSDDPIAS